MYSLSSLWGKWDSSHPISYVLTVKTCIVDEGGKPNFPPLYH